MTSIWPRTYRYNIVSMAQAIFVGCHAKIHPKKVRTVNNIYLKVQYNNLQKAKYNPKLEIIYLISSLLSAQAF